MRALLFLVAVLALAACSSSIPTSNVNPQAPNTTRRLVRANPSTDHLTLQFENISPSSQLFFVAAPIVCITSESPNNIELLDGQTIGVDIKANTEGQCKDGTPEVEFLVSFFGKGDRIWYGDLDVKYSPQKDAWTGKTRGDQGGHRPPGLCTDPPGLSDGADLHDNELIKFFFCK